MNTSEVNIIRTFSCLLKSRLAIFLFVISNQGDIVNAQLADCGGDCDDTGAGAICPDDGGYVPYSATYYGGVSTCDDRPWVVVFEDHFDGNSVNENYWLKENWLSGPPPSDCDLMGRDAAAPRDYNLIVEDGKLKLISQIDYVASGGVEYWDGFNMVPSPCEYPFTTGRISSLPEFMFGAFEICCKVSDYEGMFPAFWLFGGNNNYVVLEDYNPDFIYSPLIYENEVDIFEMDKSDNAKMSLIMWYKGSHCHPGCSGSTSEKINFVAQDNYCGPDFSEEFHYFTLIWSPFMLEYYIDGNLRAYCPRFATILGQELGCNSDLGGVILVNHSYPLNPMGFILNNVVNWKEDILEFQQTLDDLSDPQKATFEVEYVKFFNHMDCEDKNYDDLSYLNTSYGYNFPIEVIGNDPDLYHFVTGNNFIFGPNASAPGGTQITIVHAGSVDFDPGFSIEPGSNFSTQYTDISCSNSGMVLHDSSNQPHLKAQILEYEESSELSLVDEMSPGILVDSASEIFKMIEIGVIQFIRIFDMTGREIAFFSIASSDLESAMAEEASGVYIIEGLDEFQNTCSMMRFCIGAR